MTELIFVICLPKDYRRQWSRESQNFARHIQRIWIPLMHYGILMLAGFSKYWNKLIPECTSLWYTWCWCIMRIMSNRPIASKLLGRIVPKCSSITENGPDNTQMFIINLIENQEFGYSYQNQQLQVSARHWRCLTIIIIQTGRGGSQLN